METSNHLLQRLYRDLWDLHTSPDDWFRVHPSEANIRNLCLTLFPISGPFQGLSLHFSTELPLNWVSSGFRPLMWPLTFATLCILSASITTTNLEYNRGLKAP
jgi:hypothetical protein